MSTMPTSKDPKRPGIDPRGWCPEGKGQCQCVDCRPIGYCVERDTVCNDCDGPVDGCARPEGETLVIDLSPRICACGMCGVQVVNGHLAIPTYEGEPVDHDYKGKWGGLTVCRRCYDEYETEQKRIKESRET